MGARVGSEADPAVGAGVGGVAIPEGASRDIWVADAVADFSSYNKTYGALGGIVVFLVWLRISNIAVLLGAELNAELEGGRQIEAGHPAEQEPFVEPCRVKTR